MGDHGDQGDFGIEWRVLLAFAIIALACGVHFAGDFARSVPEVADSVRTLLNTLNGR